MNNDTTELLKECDAGTKMAIASIDEVLNKVRNPELRQLLTESKEHHDELDSEIHTLLACHASEEKEPSAMAKSMSWMKTNMKMSMDNSDSTAADLITDGCNMGVKTLYRYLNRYESANEESKQVCKKLIAIEEKLCVKLQPYL